MTEYVISLIPGDGIGPELTEATLKVLDAAQKKFGIKLKMVEAEAGDGTLAKRGAALPADTVEKIKASHACLKGPVGESAADVIVKLRLMFDLYANLRPIKSYPSVPAARPDIDMLWVRENTEDVYRGLEHTLDPNTTICIRVITRKACERIAKKAFEMARLRNGKKKVTAIHKANVMRVTDGLFASVCRETAKQYPDIAFNELYVDAASMRLIKEPQIFDVFCTCNMFGDILSDEAGSTDRRTRHGSRRKHRRQLRTLRTHPWFSAKQGRKTHCKPDFDDSERKDDAGVAGRKVQRPKMHAGRRRN